MSEDQKLKVGDDGELIAFDNGGRKKKYKYPKKTRISPIVLLLLVLGFIGLAGLLVAITLRVPVLCLISGVCEDIQNAEFEAVYLTYNSSPPIDIRDDMRVRLETLGTRNPIIELAAPLADQLPHCTSIDSEVILLGTVNMPPVELALLNPLTGAMCALDPLYHPMVYDIELSPDRSELAYSTYRAADGDLDIYIRAVIGGESRNVTNNRADEGGVHWSADGSWLTFQSQFGWSPEHTAGTTYRISVQGGTREPIGVDGHLVGVNYAPNGRSFLFLEKADERQAGINIFVYAPDQHITAQLTHEQAERESIEWMPDGTGIYYIEGTTLYQLLLAEPIPQAIRTDAARDFSVSPTGAAIAYTHLYDSQIVRVYELVSGEEHTFEVGVPVRVLSWR